MKPAKFELYNPLGGVLRFHSMTGSEALSSLYRFDVSALSERNDIKSKEMLGKRMTVTVELEDGRKRHFSGHCTRFMRGRVAGGSARLFRYELTLRPWLWLLTRASDCRVFHERSVRDIVNAVLAEETQGKVSDKLTQKYDPRNYCTQFNESNFRFFSRLAEQVGIYYFFEHGPDGEHTLVLVDDKTAHRKVSAGSLKYRPGIGAMQSAEDHVQSWDQDQELQSAVWSTTDFHYKDTSRGETVTRKPEQQPSLTKYEVYDYPGTYDARGEGESYASVRIEALQSEAEVFSGSLACFDAVPGLCFKLAEHPDQDFGQDYLITSASYQVRDPSWEAGLESEGTSFAIDATGIPAKQQFRAPVVTPRPSVPGVFVGLVTDWDDPEALARVRVWLPFMHSDRRESCWARVGNPWSHDTYGFFAIPRVGAEVMVTFEGGDPDRPIVIGCLYGPDKAWPKDLPDKKSVVGLRSNSLGGGGYNELSFDDEGGNELIYMQAEKDRHVMVKNDQIVQVKNDAHLNVGNDALTTVGGNLHEKVEFNRNFEAGMSMSLKVGQDFMGKAGMRYNVDAGSEIHLKSGMNLTIESGANLTLKVGGNFININSGGIFVQGTMVMINSGGFAAPGSGVTVTAPTKAAETEEGTTNVNQPQVPAGYTPGGGIEGGGGSGIGTGSSTLTVGGAEDEEDEMQMATGGGGGGSTQEGLADSGASGAPFAPPPSGSAGASTGGGGGGSMEEEEELQL